MALVFSCEFCKNSRNTLFTEHLWTTASNSSRRLRFSGRNVGRVLQKQPPEMFYKVLLEILQNSQEKTCVRPVTLFSCEFCEIFKTNFSTGQLQATASGAESASV